MRKGFTAAACLLIACGLYGFFSPASQRTEERDVHNTLVRIAGEFSAAYVQGDIDKLVSFYTDEAVIFPGNSDLMRGKEAIRKYWTLPQGRTVTHHKITALEIKLTGECAYDYGYYEVSGRNNGEAWGPTYGKYLIIWQRNQDGVWKMHLDMWNSRPKPE